LVGFSRYQIWRLGIIRLVACCGGEVVGLCVVEALMLYRRCLAQWVCRPMVLRVFPPLFGCVEVMRKVVPGEN
jgi:hypothetical protein